MGLGAITQEHVDIQEFNDKNKIKCVGAIQRFIEVMTDVNEIT